MVGRCKLEPVLKAPGFSARNYIMMQCFQVLLSIASCAPTAWSADVRHHCDGQGWAYGTSFIDLTYPFAAGRGSMGRASFVRMRRWVRTRSLVPARAEDLTAAGTFSTVGWCRLTVSNPC